MRGKEERRRERKECRKRRVVRISKASKVEEQTNRKAERNVEGKTNRSKNNRRRKDSGEKDIVGTTEEKEK